ncbi:hypothetical protein E6O75_ATG08147 [Venturia nashicola]|uniref:Uncharacterized protein n=1 Tax=Venturia nashicola TaxID=86259 RepID=A0A4Z1P840_9PEZI|nr:hypothetical protein E6O75_ATG08147 [Venturia nashicola]
MNTDQLLKKILISCCCITLFRFVMPVCSMLSLYVLHNAAYTSKPFVKGILDNSTPVSPTRCSSKQLRFTTCSIHFCAGHFSSTFHQNAIDCPFSTATVSANQSISNHTTFIIDSSLH